MKYIKKGLEPTALAAWKAQANTDWYPNYKDLRNPEKPIVLDALLAEQGHLCCYCESEIEPATAHIEHLRPQADPAVDALDYGNMLGCCTAPARCGAAKGDWWEPEMVSPLNPSCEWRLTYLGDGRIGSVSPEDGAAARTIAQLKLDAPELRALRREVITAFIAETCSPEEFEICLRRHLEPDERGRLRHFHSAVRQVFGVSAEWLRKSETK